MCFENLASGNYSESSSHQTNLRQHQNQLKVLFATFSDLDAIIASSVNDNKFAELLKEFVGTEVAYVARSRSHNSMILGYTALLRKFLSAKRYDLVICRGPIVGTIGILLRKKVVLHLDDALFHSVEIEKRILPLHTGVRGLDLLLFKVLETFAISRATGYIVSTEPGLNLLSSASRLSPERISVIPFFLENTLFELSQPLQNSRILRVAYTGNFFPHDKILEMIEAVGKCKAMGLPIKLYMIGEGPLFHEAVRYAGKLKDDSIFFLGKMIHSRIPAFMSGIDVLLAPMNTEIVSSTLPVKILEGAAAGRVVITTDCGAIRYFFRDSMVYVEEPLAENISKSLEWILSNQTQCENMAAKARSIAEENFSRTASELAMRQFLNKYARDN